MNAKTEERITAIDHWLLALVVIGNDVLPNAKVLLLFELLPALFYYCLNLFALAELLQMLGDSSPHYLIFKQFREMTACHASGKQIFNEPPLQCSQFRWAGMKGSAAGWIPAQTPVEFVFHPEVAVVLRMNLLAAYRKL